MSTIDWHSSLEKKAVSIFVEHKSFVARNRTLMRFPSSSKYPYSTTKWRLVSGSTLRDSAHLCRQHGVGFVLTSSNIQAAVYDKSSVRQSGYGHQQSRETLIRYPERGERSGNTIRPPDGYSIPTTRACALRNMEVAAALVNKHRQAFVLWSRRS